MTAASADLRQLAEDMRSAANGGMERAATDIIHEVAMKVQSYAQADAPRDTGKLAASITIVWVSKLTAVIKPTEIYGVFQEFGTGLRGEYPAGEYEIRPKKPDGYLSFVVNGQRVYARVVRHPGVRPQPFMRPALEQALEPFTRQMAEAGALLITKGPRSTL